ncbi:hypothetical protein PsorP6_011666 [Peronosclerospora sorghi]|uniref:Uncharacterized protein n=1 Tax=Peronosclerospora sorghi TaxID=230839 RepID=A0ACC0WMC1_9STRA|nr:hypothetical protein PsorP6_011666 [Peronosclerospora sorghi]
MLIEHHRSFGAPTHSTRLVPELTLKHIEVKGRLEHVKEISDGMAATSTRLQAAARKSPIRLRVEAARSALPV